MLLKREYKHQAPIAEWGMRSRECDTCHAKGVVINPELTGIVQCPTCNGQRIIVQRAPPLDHIKVVHTGTEAKQSFGTRLVDAGIKEGWLTLSKGKLIIHGRPQDLVYTIDKIPGTYCSYCDAIQGGETEARAHVKTAHSGKKSPDPESPGGYAKVNAYLCTLDRALHEKFGVKGEGH